MSDEENAQQVSGESAGSQLRRGREQKGLTVSDVANAQHLRPAVIQAIENGDYQQIDSELFLKGYVRAYAKQVGLDADAIVAMLDRELEPFRQQKAEALEANPLVDIERRKRQKRRAARAFLVLLAFAVVAALAFTFLDDDADRSENVAEEPATSGQTGDVDVALDDNVAAEPEGIAEPDVAPIEDMQPGPDSDTALDNETETEASEPLNEAAPVANSPEDEDALDESRIPTVTSSTDPALTEESRIGDVPGTGRLEVSFSGDCWVEITDSTGARLASGLRRDGDVIDVSGQVPLRVVIGAVDAVDDIRFQGEAVELSDYRVVNNRAQFSLEI
ncbi:MAG: RodZ domain-containing protein [Marinobacter sp.]|uniref:RodZ domain-containing protein n=1 Tax=Marinobacter sp. TaxID=50741 RepID=UPI003C5CA0F7